MSLEYNATVTLRADLAPGTMALRLKLDGEAFSFEPGQYTVLGLRRSTPRVDDASPDDEELKGKPADHMIRRAYSITSNSNDEELEFVVTLVRSGALSPRLFALKEGDRIYVRQGAQGIFTLGTSSGNRDLLLVATGSALAPYLSMIRTSFSETEEIKYVVVHAAAVSSDLAFRSVMDEMAEKTDRLTYLPTISQPDLDPAWEGLTGTAEQILQEGEIEDAVGMPVDPDRYDVFLSGSPEMIDNLTAALTELGFEPEDIHVERYW